VNYSNLRLQRNPCRVQLRFPPSPHIVVLAVQQAMVIDRLWYKRELLQLEQDVLWEGKTQEDSDLHCRCSGPCDMSHERKVET
jgi:hypothetical protein